ncbi:hypothetical protein CHS0354_016422 [Potamilus streckersoni]|uniref:HD domain-containing protein n=1 Tax=Potamilus streckersoni TaxID=2493646 RepID=A0AAE0W288_9BIVA|nr:hypothetical protein CHS0354_016422 [Potamilus streckersoni]
MDAGEANKIVLDPVYGMIHLEPLAVKIIDTHYFQRLRYIKQLSFADFVYPGATHTRFAHSIGVYHLASQMIKEIKAHKLPEGAAEMSPQDEMCIRVAALCHDMGHGPFSHAYEEIGKETIGEKMGSKLKHENISLFLVEKMFKDTNYDLKLKEYFGDKVEENIKLIQDLIQGKREQAMTADEKKKKYMFQIVSNADTGVDVDKWDYFHRDAKACGVPERFQYERALSVARVVKLKDKEEEVFELGYRDYDGFNFYNMFNTRFTMYRKVYKHKVVIAVHLMIKDVFKLVHKANATQEIDERSKIDLFPVTSLTDDPNSDNYMHLDEDKYLDMEKYLRLRDDVLLKLYDSSAPQYKEARDLIKRLQERKLYKFVDDICVKAAVEDAKPRAEEIEKTIKERLENEDFKDELEVMICVLNYGQKHEDPVQKLNFYSKRKEHEGNTLERDKVSLVLPSVFQEYHVLVYQKFSGKKDYKSDVESNITQLSQILNEIRLQFLPERPSSKRQNAEAMSDSTSH